MGNQILVRPLVKQRNPGVGMAVGAGVLLLVFLADQWNFPRRRSRAVRISFSPPFDRARLLVLIRHRALSLCGWLFFLKPFPLIFSCPLFVLFCSNFRFLAQGFDQCYEVPPQTMSQLFFFSPLAFLEIKSILIFLTTGFESFLCFDFLWLDAKKKLEPFSAICLFTNAQLQTSLRFGFFLGGGVPVWTILAHFCAFWFTQISRNMNNFCRCHFPVGIFPIWWHFWSKPAEGPAGF